jgi:hypothetical protein
MIRILIATLLAVIFQLSVSAQEDRNAQVVQKLYDLSQDFSGGKIVPVRGGTKDKPLGVYLGTKDDVEFRSGYNLRVPSSPRVLNRAPFTLWVN